MQLWSFHSVFSLFELLISWIFDLVSYITDHIGTHLRVVVGYFRGNKQDFLVCHWWPWSSVDVDSFCFVDPILILKLVRTLHCFWRLSSYLWDFFPSLRVEWSRHSTDLRLILLVPHLVILLHLIVPLYNWLTGSSNVRLQGRLLIVPLSWRFDIVDPTIDFRHQLFYNLVVPY